MLAAAAAPAPTAAWAGDPEVARIETHLSFQGLPGIIDVPIAGALDSGVLDVTFTPKRDHDVYPGEGAQRSVGVALGFLPRLTLGARGVVAKRASLSDSRDLSASLHLLLLEEGPVWPALAIGLQDIGGASSLFESKYVVLSKTFFERLRGTIGFGTGPDVLEGVFAGAELALEPFLTFLAEYDTDDVNLGVQIDPWFDVFGAHDLPDPVLKLVWQRGSEVTAALGLRYALGEAAPGEGDEVGGEGRHRYRRWIDPRVGSTEGECSSRAGTVRTASTAIDGEEIAGRLQAAIAALGFENVAVSILHSSGRVAAFIEYENRRFNRDELDGLGVVLGIAVTETPLEVHDVIVEVKAVDLGVFQLRTDACTFVDFLNGEIPEEIFEELIDLERGDGEQGAGRVLAARQAVNRSRFRVDAFVRPGIETILLSDLGVLDARVAVLPDAVVQLLPGMVFNARARIPVGQTQGYRDFFGALPSPRIDRVLLHQALPLAVAVPSLAQLSVGRFSSREVGASLELAANLLDGLFGLRGVIGRFGPGLEAIDRWIAVGGARAHFSSWDLAARLDGGLFLDGDRGVAGEVSRFFGDFEAGFFLRHTNHDSLAGVRVAIPLTPARELEPGWLRPRLPDLFEYEQRTVVFSGANEIRDDIGRVLRTGHEIGRAYWNRDRLHPAYVRTHLGDLKEAALRWVDDAAESGGRTKSSEKGP